MCICDMCNTTIVNTAARRLTGDGRPREGGEPALRDARYKTQLPPPESPSRARATACARRLLLPPCVTRLRGGRIGPHSV